MYVLSVPQMGDFNELSRPLQSTISSLEHWQAAPGKQSDIGNTDSRNEDDKEQIERRHSISTDVALLVLQPSLLHPAKTSKAWSFFGESSDEQLSDTEEADIERPSKHPHRSLSWNDEPHLNFKIFRRPSLELDMRHSPSGWEEDDPLTPEFGKEKRNLPSQSITESTSEIFNHPFTTYRKDSDHLQDSTTANEISAGCLNSPGISASSPLLDGRLEISYRLNQQAHSYEKGASDPLQQGIACKIVNYSSRKECLLATSSASPATLLAIAVLLLALGVLQQMLA